MSEVVTAGVVWGIDHSETMVNQATKRNRLAISAGRVRLLLASVSQLPAFDGNFDKILAVNSYQFWDKKIEILKRLKEQLCEGGLIALAQQPRNLGATEEDATRAGVKYSADLEAAGFKDIKVERKVMKPISTVCVLGRNL